MRVMYIFIDDIRSVSNEQVQKVQQFLNQEVVTCTCRSYSSAIGVLKYCHENHFPLFVDFDHDLGERYCGYDISKFIVENQISMLGYHIHSMNPVGRANIEQLLTHYGYTQMY